MDTMEAYAGKLEAQLKHWGTKLDDLLANAQGPGAEAKSEYHQRISELNAQHQATKSKLASLRAAGSDKWEAMKTDLDTQLADFEAAVKKLTSQALHAGWLKSPTAEPADPDAPKPAPQMATDHAHD